MGGTGEGAKFRPNLAQRHRGLSLNASTLNIRRTICACDGQMALETLQQRDSLLGARQAARCHLVGGCNATNGDGATSPSATSMERHLAAHRPTQNSEHQYLFLRLLSKFLPSFIPGKFQLRASWRVPERSRRRQRKPRRRFFIFLTLSSFNSIVSISVVINKVNGQK